MPNISTLGARAAMVTGLLLAGCAPSTHVLVGQARPAIAPDQVKLYTHPPAQFEQIAILDANSKSAFGPGGQKSVDKVRIPVDRDRAFRFNVTEDSEFA